MINPSLKIQERLASRLSRHGVHSGVVCGELYFMEPVKMRIPSRGMSFVIKTEYPICPFPKHGHFSHPISARVGRLARARHLSDMVKSAALPQKELAAKALDASEEFVEFLNHIRNPRVSVK